MTPVAVNFGGQLHLRRNSVITRSLAVVTLLLTACGGRAGQVAPIPEAEVGFRNFMQAVADSNFVRMSEHWGTSRGSASETGNPPDYQQRMVIVQAYLRGIRFRVLSNEAVVNFENQRLLTVELSRDNCVNAVPFTMVRTGSGRWIVYSFDLEKVGSPARGCNPTPAAPPN
jgi:hypothetical protein